MNAIASSPASTPSGPPTRALAWLDRIGIHPPLVWGFLGLLLFMVGDGVESGYLAPYLRDSGISDGRVALVFSVYGVTAAVAAWCSGALSDLWGPRKVMMLGLGIWVGFELALLILGLPGPTYELVLLSYSLRGFGYPLFAFGFLVWITAATPQHRLGTGVGWFWFAFTAGLPTLGSYLASGTIPLIGQYLTFWLSLGLVTVGGLVALVGLRERTGFGPLAPAGQRPMATLLASLTILWQRPRIGVGCVVRTINTAAQYGFLVALPGFFTDQIGFSLERWLQLLGFMFASNIVWNLIFGVVGDRIGWRRTVIWCGGVGCAVSTLLLYYVPLATESYLLSSLVGALYGATLAGYVPLSALMPSMAPEQRGGAMAALNLGAGASAFVGPAVVGLFLGPWGVQGVMWVFSGLYVASAVLAWFLVLPAVADTAPDRAGTTGRGVGRRVGRAAATSGSLLGHPPSLPAAVAEPGHDVDVVLFDLGGTVYDDEGYARALYRATTDLAGTVDEHEFWSFYDRQRTCGTEPLYIAFARQYHIADPTLLTEHTAAHWDYPTDALFPDVRPTLEVLRTRYRLGVVANSPAQARTALARDGIDALFDVVVLTGADEAPTKPDPRAFGTALERLQVPPARAVYVGNRLDTDVRGAHAAGVRSVWMLRGEAPPAPTTAQLDEADAVITSLTGLPTALARLAGADDTPTDPDSTDLTRANAPA